MLSIEFHFMKTLLQRKRQGNLRRFSDRSLNIDLASNDYLGFARDKDLQERILAAWGLSTQRMMGSTGSRLLTGNCSLFEELEDMIARFHQAEAGVLFNSGYMANIGLLSAVVASDDTCLFDVHIHASMVEGMKISQARCLPWRHNDLEHLEKRLKTAKKSRFIFVLIESIYSCDGSQAPLEEICDLCMQYNALLIVDEAHATGVIGYCGAGMVVLKKCQDKVFARVHTFSKALGVFGAIVLGSAIFKEFLINFSRPLIYTTALPHPILHGIREAYFKLVNSKAAIDHLHGLIRYFKQQAQDLPLFASDAPIQAIWIPKNEAVRSASQALAADGFDVRPLMSPTVQRGTERLRICLHAFNTKEEIDELLKCLYGRI